MSVTLRSIRHARAATCRLRRGPRQMLASRLFQVLLCLIGLALLSPVMLLVAVGVKLTSRGPVFYRGQRVGKDERTFDIYKFRTLQVDAEQQIGARLLTRGRLGLHADREVPQEVEARRAASALQRHQGRHEPGRAAAGPADLPRSVQARDPGLRRGASRSGPARPASRSCGAATGRNRATSSATRSSTSATSRCCSTSS